MRALVGLAPVAAVALLIYAGGAVPYRWTHSLTEACSWRARSLLGAVGGNGREADQWRCLRDRGLQSPSPDVRILLSRFPSPAERAGWSNTP